MTLGRPCEKQINGGQKYWLTCYLEMGQDQEAVKKYVGKTKLKKSPHYGKEQIGNYVIFICTCI